MRTILRRLTIRQKLFICSLLYILPLTVLLYFTVTGIQSDIRFTELERQGVRFLAPLEDLMQLVPRHRSLAFVQAQGAKELEPRLQETAKRIDAAFAVLLAESEIHGPSLRLDSESLVQAEMDGIQPARLKESWDKLRTGMGELIPEMSDLKHADLIANIRRLIARVGDTSNLVLDPELSSYYLVDVAVLALPRILDELGELTLLGQQIISRGKPGAQDLSRLELLSSAVNQGSLLQMQRSLTTAAKYEKQLHGENSPVQESTAKAFQKGFDSARYLLQSALVLKRGEKSGALGEFSAIGSITIDLVGKFKDEALKQLDLLLEDRVERHRQRMYSILSLTFFCLGLAAVLVLIISRGITGPLAGVVSIAGEISAGNIDGARSQIGRLGVEYDGRQGSRAAEPASRDEIWQLALAFSQMTHSLHSLVLQVQRSGIQVLASSTEISASSRQMEATAAQQAASTNQVSVTAREISSSCKLLLESVNRVLALASETLDLAQEGHKRLSGMKSNMGELMKATSSIASQLDGIRHTTGSIGSVITTMTKVADQTNLLSLNATIEAEKAGKYGLGFSVVAREIQRLADQTAVATLDIEHLVRKMESTVSAGVAEMDCFVGEVRETVQEVETISSEVVSSMIKHLHELLPRFDELGAAMNAQSEGAEEISKAMSQLSEGAEQTRRVIHDFTSVTNQLIGAAGELKDEVSRFNASSRADEDPA